MSRYGIDFYGAGDYGSPSFGEFDATPFEVLPIGPGENQLHWSMPFGEWTRLRLVRNAYGWPVHEDDGRILLDLNSGPAAEAPLDEPTKEYIDTDLQPGRLYYYSIFVRAFDDTNTHDEWLRAADTTGISVGAFNYTERLLDLLPEVYWSDPTDDSGRNDQFVRFLSIFGFQLDYIRSQYETLRYLYHPDKVAAGLLGPLGDMFGVNYEPDIGARQHRSMVRNAVYIARRKATYEGTNTLVSSFTGWDAQITVGVNQMLDYNDSSGEEYQGRWQGLTLCTVSYRPTDGSIAAWQSGLFSNKQAGMVLMTSKAAGDMNMGCGWRAPVSQGVPVTVGQAYTLSAYVQPATTGRASWVGIRWCNARGARISGTTGASSTTAVDAWTRLAVTGTAPAGAVYAVPFVSVTTLGAGEQHAVDAVQFEAGSSASAYQEARDIRIVLHAERINELPNPSAEVNTTGWTGALATLSRDTTTAFSGTLGSATPTTTVGAPNAASFKLVSTSTSPGDMHTPSGSSGIPVQGGEDYAASAYFYGAVNLSMSLTFFDSDGASLTTVTGQTFNYTVSAWTRADVSATAPDDAAYVQVYLNPLYTASGQSLWADQILLERCAEVRPYFDASQFGSRPADNIWEGTAHQSRSHYYFNRTAKTFRLNALLNDYLMLGSTHTLLVAQPFQLPNPPLDEDTGAFGMGAYGVGPFGTGGAAGYGVGAYGSIPYV